MCIGVLTTQYFVSHESTNRSFFLNKVNRNNDEQNITEHRAGLRIDNVSCQFTIRLNVLVLADTFLKLGY